MRKTLGGFPDLKSGHTLRPMFQLRITESLVHVAMRLQTATLRFRLVDKANSKKAPANTK